MKRTMILIGCALALISMAAGAQSTTPPGGVAEPLRMFIASREVTERIAQLAAVARSGTSTHEGVSSLVSWGPFRGNLIYRIVPGAASYANEDYAEFYVVLKGAGTMMIGGTLTDAKRTGFRTEAASSQGGTAYRVVQGDMIMVPPGTAHGVVQVEGELAYLSMHLPLRPDVSAAKAASH